MRHRPSLPAGMVLALALCSGTRPASAATSFDFLFSMDHVTNDSQFFLNVAVTDYGYSRPVLEPILPRLRYVEVDLPVVLFLAHESGRPVDAIVGQRPQGRSGWGIFERAGVRPDVLFVGIDRDPGPPYGKAWGYWKKRPKVVRFSDADVAGLVQVQIGARAAGLPPYEVARARGQGKRVATLVADKRGRPFHAGKPGKNGGPEEAAAHGQKGHPDKEKHKPHGKP